MEAFTTLNGLVAPIDRPNVDTDAIIPKQFLKSIKKTGFGPNLFDEWRYLDKGEPGQDPASRKPNPDFVLNQPRYAGASILLARKNFGCGSSRESAVWCLTGVGIRCVIARSIADIFRENCLQNGLLPIELSGAAMDLLQAQVIQIDGSQAFFVDLPAQIVRAPNGETFAFEISASDKTRLIEGLDEIGMTMKHESEIVTFEQNIRASMPWMQEARDRRL